MEMTKLKKSEKAILVMFALVVCLDIFYLIHSIEICDTFGVFLYILWIVNVLSVCWVYYNYIQIRKRCKELQGYDDDAFKYFDYQYDQDNIRGHYGIQELEDAYWVHKYCDDCVLFIVKVFKFNPTDDNSKAEAESKAKELLNLITEVGTLWRE